MEAFYRWLLGVCNFLHIAPITVDSADQDGGFVIVNQVHIAPILEGMLNSALYKAVHHSRVNYHEQFDVHAKLAWRDAHFETTKAMHSKTRAMFLLRCLPKLVDFQIPLHSQAFLCDS